MPLIKDLIPINEVHRGDFVLNLAEGVEDPERTLQSYVATDQLLEAFKLALRFIRSGLPEATGGRKTSRATYLHGSFGCGKSHFMAVLSLLLDNHPLTRERKELLPLINENDWLEGKRFLLVPYNMVGKTSMEDGVLGGYAKYIHQLHPEAPAPAIYPADDIIENAKRFRDQMGDQKFFGMLNQGDAGDGDWGDWSGSWNTENFDSVADAHGLDEDKLRLVADLSEHVFPAMKRAGTYVNLDDGLVIISRHAKALGYDALILFLDELILWLMSRSADVAFVQSECQKLGILREGRPPDLPILSFVARQRDLRQALGEHLPGADRLRFEDNLQWWEGRFDRIDLEDRNLPVIARERLLKPKSDTARSEIDAAFKKSTPARQEIMRILLTETGDRSQFRDLYPFSPALMEVLVAVSAALQRERTALKVLAQLLWNQRETLDLGRIVPVGDLWDVIAEGEEVFEQALKLQMDLAKRLYREKLRPLLLDEHQIPQDWDGRSELSSADGVTKRANFENDARLIKTLLLAALTPQVESLRRLNARKLAALNHGTIKSPIPGREDKTVLTKLRRWASHAGEIRLSGDSNDPEVTIELTGVDTEGILAQARGEDNLGNRKRLIQDLLFKALGIQRQDSFFTEHSVTWRGTPHACEIVYTNVFEANDESLTSTGGGWKVIIDYPFDIEGRTPADDQAIIGKYLKGHPDGTRTIVWLPRFFSEAALGQLGDLVVLDFVLSGERFSGYATHLSPQDQQSARAVLDNRRAALEQKMINALEAAYGLHQGAEGLVEEDGLSFADRFKSLLPGFDPQPPDAANLSDGLSRLLFQALAHQFPAHPEFGVDVKPGGLRRVWEYVSQALKDRDRRTAVDKRDRNVMKLVAEPLRLGIMGGTHFALGRHWVEHFERLMAAENVKEPTVRQLAAWMDDPAECGLDAKVRSLAICTFAGLTDREFYHYGAAAGSPSFEKLDQKMELREVPLPDEGQWETATKRAAALFGLAEPSTRSAATVSAFQSQVLEKARVQVSSAALLITGLEEALGQIGMQADQSDRMKGAVEANGLLDALRQANDSNVVATLANASVDSELAHLARSISSAEAVTEAIRRFDWKLLCDSQGLPGEFGADAKKAMTRAKDVLNKHELQVPGGLSKAFDEIQEELRTLTFRALEAAKKRKDDEGVTPVDGGEKRRKQDEEDPNRFGREDEAEYTKLDEKTFPGREPDTAASWVKEHILKRPNHDFKITVLSKPMKKDN